MTAAFQHESCIYRRFRLYVNAFDRFFLLSFRRCSQIAADAQIAPFLHPSGIIPPSPPAPPGSANLTTSAFLNLIDFVFDNALNANLDYFVDRFTGGTGDARANNINATVAVVPLAGLGSITLGLNAIWLGTRRGQRALKIPKNSMERRVFWGGLLL